MTISNRIHITINMEKLKYNIQHTYDLCKEKNVNLAVVSKSICADQQIMELIEQSAADTIADSRIDNLAKMSTAKRKLLIRPSSPKEAEDVVLYSDASLETELFTVKALEAAAERQHRIHDILIMVDLGDLRDGIMYTDEELLLETAGYVHNSPWLRLSGIAANYNCLLGYLPDKENMSVLAAIKDRLTPFFDLETPIVSGGNSSSFSLLSAEENIINPAINQFRMGEAIMLGRDPADNTLISGYAHDVFTLYVPLIEVQEKQINNASSPEIMRRGILAVGKQDLQTEHILPRDTRIKVLGACSDECVVDLTAAKEYQVGDLLAFDMEYGALMTAFAGSYICRIYE